MASKMYQKNPGRDDDWIAEGDLAETDLRQLGSNHRIAGIEFSSVAQFPERPFRHLASMRRLKHLQFHSWLFCLNNPAPVGGRRCPRSPRGQGHEAENGDRNRIESKPGRTSSCSRPKPP
jgi:hypothetical protein